MKELEEKIAQLEYSIQQHAMGLQNVYDQFKKLGTFEIAEKIQALNERLDHYEKEKNVVGFDFDVKSYPMNIRIRMNITTNFGQIKYTYDYPPFLEGNLGNAVFGTYCRLLDKLYAEHDKRGGKYVGDEDCKKWFDENGETIVDEGENFSPRFT